MDNGISLIWIFVILLIALVVFILTIIFSVQDAEKKSVLRPLNIKQLRKIFKKATKLIESNVASKSKRYEVPWIVLLNEGDENQRLPIENSQISNNLPTDDSLKIEGNSFIWHFFNRGVVIELQSRALRSGDFDEDSESRWEEFLKLCGSYRSQRPLDSIVISVPAKILLESENDDSKKIQLRKLAESTSRRIWIAQNRYAMRFAVYLVVSGCEELDGFESFGDSLPAKMQDGMLGWSSPYNSDISYQSNWIDEAFDSITSSISNLSAELMASDTRSKSNIESFLLPSRIERLKAGIKLYTDNLMGVNNFYDPFYFRGLYLTSSTKKPFFLKHIFEEKVFPEFGLTKAAHSQKLKNPIMHGFIKWSLISFLSIWSFGLIFSVVKVSQILPILTEGIEGLNKDSRQRSDALATGQALDFSWYRKTAIALMVGIEELSSARYIDGEAPTIIFIPGSWPIFDDLFAKVQNRIENEFAEMGIKTFKRAIEFKTSQISGADYDSLSGKLLNPSNSCENPKLEITALDKKSVESLKVQSIPEFRALQKLISDSQKLSEAISAMERLKSPSRSGTDDLKILTRYALDAELTGDLNGILRLFNKYGDSQFRTMFLDSESISSAIKCSVINGVIALNNKIFFENPLIKTEKIIVTAQNNLLGLSLKGKTSSEIIETLRILQNEIEAQEIILSRGGGLWMTKEQFSPGIQFTNLVDDIKNNKMLGPKLAENIISRINKDFAALRVEYDLLHFRSGTEIGVVASVDKNGNELFAQSPQRIALRNAVDKLLNEPFMVPTTGLNLDLTESIPGSLVSWDSQALNEAVKLKDYRSKVISKDVPLFPEQYRNVIKEVIDQKIGLRMIDLIEQSHYDVDSKSITTNTYIDDIALYEENQKKLRILFSLMKEMNRNEDLLVLKSIIANDAISRLNIVEKNFEMSEFLASTDDSFSSWKGGSGFMRIGFGISDKVELFEVYKAQLLRIEKLSNLANKFLSVIPKKYLSLRDIEKWESIRKELELYKLKDSSGILLKFENFLIDLTENFSVDKCDSTLDLYKPKIELGNFFGSRFEKIHSDIRYRCSAIKRQTAAEQWAIFSNDFDRYFGGQKPFIEPKKFGLNAKMFSKKTNVNLYDIPDFFSRIPNQNTINQLFKNPNDKISATKFYQEVKEIKNLFSSLISENSGAVQGLDLNVNFRVNQEQEIYGNRIIDWKIAIGSNTYSLRDEQKNLKWMPGDKITFSIRFAENTSVTPLSNFSNPFYQSIKKIAIFRYDDLWSLLDLIQMHRIENVKDRKNRTSQLLKFEFPVSLSDDGTKMIGEKKSNARVYLILNIVDPVTKKQIKWPKNFPIKSPVFTNTLVENISNKKLSDFKNE